MQVSGFGIAKLIDLFLLEDAGSAELMGDERDLREMLDGLHLLEGFEQGAAIADCTVIGHEDSVVEGKEGDEAGRYLAGAGRGVGCEGNDTEGHHGFLTEHLLEAAARAGEGGGDGRMGVDDCANVVAVLVDGEVHAELTGHLARSFQLSALEIDDDHVFGGEQKLADAGGSDEQALSIEADR